MNRTSVFILVPSDQPVGPIKGAYALANALAGHRRVTLVSLKEGPGAEARLDPRVSRISFAAAGGHWTNWVKTYRRQLESAGGRRSVASISMCCSADLVNRFCADQALICASVRGNLLENYRFDYGLAGAPWAMVHLAALRPFDHVVAMTESMARQVERYVGRPPVVIGNFVDEQTLEPFRVGPCRNGPLRFVFVGTLSRRKQPLLLAQAARQLLNQHIDLSVDVVGYGPMSQAMAHEVDRLSLHNVVRLHGHVPEPHGLLAAADAFVLPSLSEGVSRAALEALYLGVPCVLRDCDGNRDLLAGSGGSLFRRDEELASAMLSAARMARQAEEKRNRLPVAFRQETAVRGYLELVDQT